MVDNALLVALVFPLRIFFYLTSLTRTIWKWAKPKSQKAGGQKLIFRIFDVLERVIKIITKCNQWISTCVTYFFVQVFVVIKLSCDRWAIFDFLTPHGSRQKVIQYFPQLHEHKCQASSIHVKLSLDLTDSAHLIARRIYGFTEFVSENTVFVTSSLMKSQRFGY